MIASILRKSLFSYPWIRDRYKRKYMLGCLKAAMKSGFERRFYDLGRIRYRGQKEVDFGFDPERVVSAEELREIENNRARVGSSYQTKGNKVASVANAVACGGGPSAGDDASVEPRPYQPDEDELIDAAAILGEAPIDEFFDPRGFARQRSRAKRLSAQK